MVQGKAHKYPDNVDTDVIIHARYLNTADHKELALSLIHIYGLLVTIRAPGKLAPAILEVRTVVDTALAAAGLVLGLFRPFRLGQLFISAEELLLFTHLPSLLSAPGLLWWPSARHPDPCSR